MLVTEGDSWTRPAGMRVPIRLGVGENLFTQTGPRVGGAATRGCARVPQTRALDTRLAGLDALIAPEAASIPFDEEIDLGAPMGRIALDGRRVGAARRTARPRSRRRARRTSTPRGRVGRPKGRKGERSVAVRVRCRGPADARAPPRARGLRRRAHRARVASRARRERRDRRAARRSARRQAVACRRAAAITRARAVLRGQRDHRRRARVGARARRAQCRRVGTPPRRARAHPRVHRRDPEDHTRGLGLHAYTDAKWCHDPRG